MQTTFRLMCALIVVSLVGLVPAPSLAQLSIGISINIGPPPMPYYQPAVAYYAPNPELQPAPPAPNLIWEPGYWAWGPGGYYWVPGTWVEPPAPGLVWTPGYWSNPGSGFVWNNGYWATSVGFYGGVNYGCGYYGNGYVGGRWSGNRYEYNTAVTNVNTTIIRNVYINRTVIVENNTVNRVSYNGGPGGLRAQPTVSERFTEMEHHIPPTALQEEHAKEAAGDRSLLASANHGKPQVLTVERPLSVTNRPTDFEPVTPADEQAAMKYVKKGSAVPPAVYHTEAPTVQHTAAPMVHYYTPAVHHTAAPTGHHTAAPMVHYHKPAVHYTAAPVHHHAPGGQNTTAPKPKPTQNG